MEVNGLTIPLSVLIFVVGWIVIRVFKGRDDKKAADTALSNKNSDRIDKIERQLLELDFQVKPMWAKVQKQLSEDLHHPHAKDQEMDLLLEQLEDLTIDTNDPTGKNRHRLKQLLLARSKDMSPDTTESERASAQIMATVMDKVLKESASTSEMTDVEMVGVQKPVDVRTGTQKIANASRKGSIE